MAYNDSDQIAPGDDYQLGEYTFTIQSIVIEGERVIQAHCSGPDGNAAHGIAVPTSTQFIGWYVEANEMTADVYAVIEVPERPEEGDYYSGLDTSPVTKPIPAGAVSCVYDNYPSKADQGSIVTDTWSGAIAAVLFQNDTYTAIFASSSPATIILSSVFYSKQYGTSSYDTTSENLNSSYTYNGKTVYYVKRQVNRIGFTLISNSPASLNDYPSEDGAIAWTIIYGNAIEPEYKEKTVLLARFPIRLVDAGGVGPDSDWDDPGDYDPDWEPEDPTHTLYVTVTGALSGRHNDPIVDPNYSYIPADKDTVKDYGCGGDGGHGGGGGAGASTVVVHKFATNQANSKEVTAIARRHGYGSGGGKGGKGGDGCILIYY